MRPASTASAGSGQAEDAFRTPPEFRSKDGQLFVTMEARPTQVTLGGREISGATYNGVYTGPVLRLKQGDTLHFHLLCWPPARWDPQAQLAPDGVGSRQAQPRSQIL